MPGLGHESRRNSLQKLQLSVTAFAIGDMGLSNELIS